MGRIVELDGGKSYGYEANYSKYLELKSQREEMTRASERKRQALLKKEYEWIMRGARARTTKSTERIARYEALKAQEAPQEAKKVEMAAAASRLGRKTVEIRARIQGLRWPGDHSGIFPTPCFGTTESASWAKTARESPPF